MSQALQKTMVSERIVTLYIYIYKSEKNKLNSSTYKAKQVVAHEELPTATDGGVDCTLFES